MLENFVTYPQALALKKLGYDEPCLAAYINKTLKGCGAILLDVDGYYINSNNETDYLVAAPLKSQVFKWFRDEHKLWVSFAYDEDESEELYWYVDKILKYGIGRLFFHDLIEYNTYEEAESVCIDKLIEIIKNKK